MTSIVGMPPTESSPIKSIRRGETTIAQWGNVNIGGTVNTSKSFVNSSFRSGSAAASSDLRTTLAVSGSCKIVSSTQLYITKGFYGYTNPWMNITVFWEVVEYV